VAAGRDSARVATVDVAPTLARMLGVAAPAELDGKVLDVAGR
jgi:arylsulfatase A-like enzyme